MCHRQFDDKDGKAASVNRIMRNATRIQHRAVYVKTLGVDDKERTVTNVISREVPDRDREVVRVRGLDLDNFRKNPVVFFMHDPVSVIGKSLWQKIRRRANVNEMIALTKFAETPLANEVFELQKGDFLRGASVGLNMRTMVMKEIKAADVRKNPDLAEADFFIDEAELLEYSIVSVPANPDALTAAVDKGLVKLTEPILEPLLRASIVRTKPKYVHMVEPGPTHIAVVEPAPVVRVVTQTGVPRICPKIAPADTAAKMIAQATAFNDGCI